MKTKLTVLNLFLLLMTALLFSCGLEEDSTGTQKEEFKNREYLLGTYEKIMGQYLGQIQDEDKSFPVELSFFIVEIKDGIDENGNPKFRPALKARYRRTDFVGESDNEILDVKYFPETNQIVMSSVGASGIFLSFTGVLEKSILKAEAIKNGGRFGSLSVKLHSRYGKAPFDSLEVDKRFRLRTTFEKIVGTYIAEVEMNNSSSESNNLTIEIVIYVVESAEGVNSNGEPVFMPKLKGRYRTKGFLGYGDNQILDVRFYAETGEIILNSSSQSQSNVNIRGLVKQDIIENGNLIMDGGLLGKFVANRISREVNLSAYGEIEEKRNRLLEVYEKLTGTYKGYVTGEREKKFPVEITLFVVEEDMGKNINNEVILLPALRARYNRLDVSDSYLDRFLSVSYFYLSNEIVLRSVSSVATGSNVPGAGLFSITGKIKSNKIIQADIFDHRGYFGKMEVEKN